MIIYSPFKDNDGNNKEFNDITFEDLKILADIKENYSIEYKRDFNKIKEEKLPKAASAFSNRSGGWFFIGINDNGTINDIDVSDITEDVLYSSVESRVSPIPLLDIKIVKNPNNKKLGVVVIYIHKGTNTPYIANGVVYVRNGKSSDPAERAEMEILMKQSMDYSDIELKCLDCQSGKFTTEYEPLPYVTLSPKYSGEKYVSKFSEQFSRAEKTILYIENKGRHFDENIELILKINKSKYFGVLSHLQAYPNEEYDEILSDLLRTPQNKEISEFKGEFITCAPPQKLFGHVTPEYKREYMEYLVDREYPYEIVVEKDFVYMKITFKVINAGQKMFLPSAILSSWILKEIEYTITSKHSFGIIKGKLTNY